MDITTDNYEGILPLYLDGELSAAETQEVESFLDEHPEIREEMMLYVESPRLEPLEKSPMAPVKQPKRGMMLYVREFTAAACLLLLFGIGGQLLRKDKVLVPEAVEVAQVDKSKTEAIEPIQRTEQEWQPSVAQNSDVVRKSDAPVEEIEKSGSNAVAELESLEEIISAHEEEPIDEYYASNEVQESQELVTWVSQCKMAYVDYSTFVTLSGYDPLEMWRKNSIEVKPDTSSPETELDSSMSYLPRTMADRYALFQEEMYVKVERARQPVIEMIKRWVRISDEIGEWIDRNTKITLYKA